MLSSCKWVSGASGEMKFGILVGGLKTTYHALRPWLDPRIWKSKDFLMYNFSAADQSTAAGHEDLSPSSLSVFHIRTRSAYRSTVCGWPWPLWIIPNPRFSLSRALASPPPSLYPFSSPIMLAIQPPISPNPRLCSSLAPARVINYLMESIWH